MLDTILRGADRDRTDDLRLAKPALSQLSYSPETLAHLKGAPSDLEFGLGRPNSDNIVGQGRLELPTSRLSGVRSNHLSYWPGWHADGLHPTDAIHSLGRVIANRESNGYR